jgi:isocitrate dehydrogenase kinase/phosphatase
MSALTVVSASAAPNVAAACTPQEIAALLVAHFRDYNEEFGRITRRAAEHFLSGDIAARERDAVARIELYEQRVGKALRALREAGAGAARPPSGKRRWRPMPS